VQSLSTAKTNPNGNRSVGIWIAMRFIHSWGIIHRNLTPGTILLDWDWRVHIAGFGHSVLWGESDIPQGDPDPQIIATNVLSRHTQHAF
jgi:serine/threonine protein kinase